MSLFPTKPKTSISHLSVSVDVCILGTSEKETYTSLGLLCLVSLTYNFQGWVTLQYTSELCSLLLVNHIWISRPFSSWWTIVEFPFWPDMTNTLIFTHKIIFVRGSYIFIFLGLEFVGSDDNSMLDLLKCSNRFPNWLHHFISLLAMYKSSTSPHSHLHFLFSIFLGNNQPRVWSGVYHLTF